MNSKHLKVKTPLSISVLLINAVKPLFSSSLVQLSSLFSNANFRYLNPRSVHYLF